ncbi:hypothetical protein N657DRAFT_644765 [Parathielavia appendiculata]|uniref:C2H2-type domain-containing protein n=1 Tax=Parathielavia appendiculata TaxID=2587402 RepID=A0AAN6U223_9PEZI|nr:hypothetical protein N657DRAFT_644765 [Parathielavia appendiculata]
MFECGDCGRAFPAGWRARDQHCEATGHSRPEYECDICDAYFDSEYSRRQHMIQDHLYCCDCDRYFQNFNNIKQHLNSKTHRGSTIKCPFCAASYTTAGGMTHHLERGSCPCAANLDRRELFRLVRSRDPRGLISNHSIEPITVTYTADRRSWNGRGYECSFCYRTFASLSGLNQHLNSPVHQEVLYHCPNQRCGVEFKTLAAIVNHLESETCGAMRFETVQRRIGDIVSGNRMLRF